MALIDKFFPWLDLSDAQWGCFTINRAEANISNHYRPDDALYIEEDNVLVAWPTKLTLAPSLADKLIEYLTAISITPMQIGNTFELDTLLDKPRIATANWD